VSGPDAISQLARLAGRAEFAQWVGLEAADLPPALDGTQAARARALVDERFDAILAGLVAEAMACDDVHDVDSACAYLEDRLRFLGDLLSLDQQERVRTGFVGIAQTWAI
jgi:hypothetical protein